MSMCVDFLANTTANLASGVLAFALLPKSPYHTGHLFGGLIRMQGWLNEREADILVARQARQQDNQGDGSNIKIQWKDMCVLPLLGSYGNFD